MVQSKQAMWQKQQQALRDPTDIFAGGLPQSGITAQALDYKVTDGFLEILAKLHTTLLVTREYEHLVLSLSPGKTSLRQGFLHVPHPSGLAVNRKTNSVYVAATRNPNQIWELRPTVSESGSTLLVPVRTKIYPGYYYFHDLAVINDQLFGTSVGQNAIIQIDFASAKTESPTWWPKSIENKSGHPNTSKNFLQLNSISGGNSLEDSFFSASSSRIRSKQPGDPTFPVDRLGVIFSGKTREVVATGLTRPHSVRWFNNQLWVDDSGYGTVGYIDTGTYVPVFKVPGWTRGLCFIGQYAFVGVSRILPRFSAYAPGLDEKKCRTCGVYVFDLKTGLECGRLTWPFGNQIFAIDFVPTTVSSGFVQETVQSHDTFVMDYFYRYQVH